MCDNSKWTKNWNGHHNNGRTNFSPSNGQSYNWGDVSPDHQNGQHSAKGYNGHHSANGQGYSPYVGHVNQGYSYNGHSNTYSNTHSNIGQQSHTGQGWTNSSHMTGQATSYFVQSAPHGHGRQGPPPPYHKQQKVIIRVIFS